MERIGEVAVSHAHGIKNQRDCLAATPGNKEACSCSRPLQVAAPCVERHPNPSFASPLVEGLREGCGCCVWHLLFCTVALSGPCSRSF